MISLPFQISVHDRYYLEVHFSAYSFVKKMTSYNVKRSQILNFILFIKAAVHT